MIKQVRVKEEWINFLPGCSLYELVTADTAIFIFFKGMGVSFAWGGVSLRNGFSPGVLAHWLWSELVLF